MMVGEMIYGREPYEAIHPGEVLLEDFINGFGITEMHLAKSIGVPPRRINEIVHGKRAITADTALRLAKYFGVEPQFWLNLQSRYDLEIAEEKVTEQLELITPVQVGQLPASSHYT